MKMAVPKAAAPRKRSRARLYPARIEMTTETEVATTATSRLFFIQVTKSVFWIQSGMIMDHYALDPEGNRLEIVEFRVRLEGRHHHEVEGEEHEEDVGREARVGESVRSNTGAAAPHPDHRHSFRT